MKNVLILHGLGSSSQDNWFPYVKSELENRGIKVWVPDLPIAEKPNILRYRQYILERWQFDKDSIIIGHSAGAVAAVGLLQYLPVGLQIDKEILVAPFKDNLGKNDLAGLFIRPLDYSKVRNHCKKFIIISSDNDPNVPFEHTQFLTNQLNAELVILDGQKHFNIQTMGIDYTKFPQILKYI